MIYITLVVHTKNVCLTLFSMIHTIKCGSHHTHAITPKEYCSHQKKYSSHPNSEDSYHWLNVTLNQVSSHSKLVTWRRNMTPNTNDTHTRKPEPYPVVCVKLFLSLDASRRLHEHDTCAPSSYTPPLLLSHPTRIPCDSRVHKLAILKIRVTCVVNCVR